MSIERTTNDHHPSTPPGDRYCGNGEAHQGTDHLPLVAVRPSVRLPMQTQLDSDNPQPSCCSDLLINLSEFLEVIDDVARS